MEGERYLSRGENRSGKKRFLWWKKEEGEERGGVPRDTYHLGRLETVTDTGRCCPWPVAGREGYRCTGGISFS